MEASRQIQRQPAWLMLASEFGESTLNEKGSGEFDPTFVITKLGAKVNRIIVSVREDSGTIMRCPDCRRVLREGQCFDHGAVEGNEDVRLRLVLDDNASTCALLVSKDAALSLLNTDHATMVDEIQANGSMAYVQKIRDMLLGCELDVTGRIINDGQGAMILCDGATFTETDTGLIATELRAQWGLQ